MKKLLIALLISLTTTVMADISVFFTSTGFVGDNGGGFSTADRYVQLLWCATDPISSTAVWGSANYLAAGEYELYAAANNNWASFSGDYDAGNVYVDGNVGDVNINSGYIFARVFESSTITAATHYWQSVALGPVLTEYSALDTGTVMDFQITTDVGGPYNATTSMAVVPEPSTVGLLLVGAGLVALRRFRRG